MKKALKIAGIVLLIIAGLFTSVWIYLEHNTQAYSTTAVPYVKDAIAHISTWSPSAAKELLADEVLANTKDEELAKLLRWFKKLGQLQTIQEPVLTNLSNSASLTGGKQTLITYLTEANYESGDAQITIRLLEVEGGFKVYQFHLNSNALID